MRPYLHTRTGGDETQGKAQKRMERGSGKRSSKPGSEKMEKYGDGQKKKGHCSTGQSSHRAVVPVEEEEDAPLVYEHSSGRSDIGSIIRHCRIPIFSLN
jgi:hypothetical protein